MNAEPSAVTSAHLRISPSGDFVFNLPYASSGSAQWTFTPTGTYTTAALIEALKRGNIYVGIDTANYPTGEASGTFLQASGSQTFTAPAAPPVLPAGAPGAPSSLATRARRRLSMADT